VFPNKNRYKFLKTDVLNDVFNKKSDPDKNIFQWSGNSRPLNPNVGGDIRLYKR
jgi:hypothetical protein